MKSNQIIKATLLILLLTGIAFVRAQTDQEESALTARPAGKYKLIANYQGPHIPINKGWVLVGAEQAGAGIIQFFLFNPTNGQTVIWYAVIQP